VEAPSGEERALLGAGFHPITRSRGNDGKGGGRIQARLVLLNPADSHGK